MKTTEDRFAALMGIDWADQKHDVCIMDAGTGKCEQYVIKQTPEALDEWVGKLQSRFPGGRIAICIEQSRGALIHSLMMHECFVIYCVNPKALHHYRSALHPSGSKDDPADAKLLLEFLCNHRGNLKSFEPDSEQTRLLAYLVQDRRNAVDERTRLSNALTAALKGYYPQALELAGSEISQAMACEFLLKWPSIEVLKKAEPQTVRGFYYAHRCRRPDVINNRLDAIKTAQALTTDKAVIEASIMKVKMLAEQLLVLAGAIKEYDKRIAGLFKEHSDSLIFSSFPAAAEQLAPRLLAAFGDNRERFESPAEVQQLSGIAPVTERSGKQCKVRWRRACPKFLRQTFHEYAACSIRKSIWAEAYYEQKRAAGASHHAAVRALAFKWIRIMFRCWKNRTPYDEVKYLKALKKRKSPLMSRIAGAAA